MTKHTRVVAVLAAWAGLALAGGAFADDDKAKSGDPDKTFVKKAAVGGLFEVKSSQLAEQRGTGAGAKTFARHMVEDHSKANKELESLAAKKGLELPKELDDKHQKVMDKLSGLSGEEFDREYMTAQVKAHKEAVKLFEDQSKGGQDADLKAWATKTLPTLREHLRMAERHAPKCGAAGTGHGDKP
jgi:putative membrane protein